MSVLGWDIGGANIKAAHTCGETRCVPFELWKRPEDLKEALASIASAMPRATLWAVTMTGELCDCFESKARGVSHILQATQAAAASTLVRVWQTDGCFVDIPHACAQPLKTAAANWHALATWTAQEFCSNRNGILMDIGSTTADFVLLAQGRPEPTGLTDPDRLQSGELVYSGILRTPVCALVRSMPYRGRPCSVAAEFFATTLDVYLLLGQIPEQPESRHTADGRPATRACAAARMARMVCADSTLCSMEEAEEMARAAARLQLETLTASCRHVLGRSRGNVSVAILSGSGEFLARRIAENLDTPLPALSLTHAWGRSASEAACAWSVAHLARTCTSE